jgi:hypothetical protein
VLQAAEAQEEIELAQSLYDDEAENEH